MDQPTSSALDIQALPKRILWISPQCGARIGHSFAATIDQKMQFRDPWRLLVDPRAKQVK